MEDKIKCENLGKYGINLLNEKIEDVLKNIESENNYNKYNMVHDLYKKAYINETLTFNHNKARDEIFDNYDFDDMMDILVDVGYDYKYALTQLTLQTIHVILSENEMLKYVNDIYNKIERDFCGELNWKETLIATIFEIGKQNHLDFVDKIKNPIYEKVKNIAAELGMENEKIY